MRCAIVKLRTSKAARQRCESGFESSREQADLKIGVETREGHHARSPANLQNDCAAVRWSACCLRRTRCVRAEENDLRAGLQNLQTASRPHLSDDPRDYGQATPWRRL